MTGNSASAGNRSCRREKTVRKNGPAGPRASMRGVPVGMVGEEAPIGSAGVVTAPVETGEDTAAADLVKEPWGTHSNKT